MKAHWLRRLSAVDRVTLGVVVAWTAVCTGPGHVWLVHLLHPLVLGAGWAWALLLAYHVVHAIRAERALRRLSSEATIHGIACRVLPGDEAASFAIGGLRPQIYIAQATLDRLGDDETRAVMLHEDYHRRTLAPLRAAAIAAWLTLCGWIPFMRQGAERRLAGLEIRADRWALAHGATAAAIARAMLADPRRSPRRLATAFAGGGEARVRWLGSIAHGQPAMPSSIPWEVAPLAFVLLPLAACLLVGPAL